MQIAAFNLATQTLAESLAAAQKHHLNYALSVFESTIALLTVHVESTRALLEQWEQQAHAKRAEQLMPIQARTTRALADALSQAYAREIKPSDSEGLQFL